MGRSKKGSRSQVKLPTISPKSRNIAAYWLDSLRESARIDALAEDSEHLLLSLVRVRRGNITPDEYRELYKRGERSGRTMRVHSEKALDIVLCPIRISSNGRFVKSPFFVPLCVNESGELMPPRKSLPWFSRLFLEPSINDSATVIGTFERARSFYRKNPPEFHDFESYLRLAENYFRYVTGFGFDAELGDLLIERNASLSILEANFSIQEQLLREVLEGKRHPGMLESLTKIETPKRALYSQSLYGLFTNARRHVAHFSTRFSLAPSQREAMHRFCEDAKVLPLAGPPGTGKTTVLQDFIASKWVRAALDESEFPPIQLVCGATNQSVLNVIDSFAVRDSEGLIAERWLPEVSSYGTFCSSYGKSKEVEGYQLELRDGGGLSSVMEVGEYLGAAEEFFLSRYKANFGEVKSVKRAVKKLHGALKTEERKLASELGQLLGVGVWDMLSSPFSRLSEETRIEKLEKISQLDLTIRNRMFLLATHYWEARWLLAVYERLRERARRSDLRVRFRPRPEDWGLRAMVTPVFVSTLSTACRFFSCRENAFAPSVDYLYFDEAAQASPEAAAPIAVLAKRIIAIGDAEQLEPHSGIPEHLDRINLIDNRVLISGKNTYGELEGKGLTAASGNFLQRASNICQREDGRIIGGMLREHRRSVPSIVGFCNDLSYGGRLIAKRPALKSSVLPSLGLFEVGLEDEKVGQSRRNLGEAQLIADFINHYSKEIQEKYKTSNISQVVGILTPFTVQSRELKDLLLKKYPGMTIGTVHSLQGAEREIVIFSSVYGYRGDRKLFFDRDTRLLNVAVSRAKDSFIFFGSREVLESGIESGLPSGVLARHIFSQSDFDVTM